MRYYAIFIFCLLSQVPVQAQQYWSRTFEVIEAGEQPWQMAILDNELFIGAAAPCHGDFNACYVLVFLNFEGEVQRSTVLAEPGYKFWPTGTPGASASDDSYRLSFHCDFFEDSLKPYLVYLNKSTLEIDSFKSFPILKYDEQNVQGHLALSNGGTIEYVQEYNRPLGMIVLHYRNSKGELEWSKKMTEQFRVNSIRSHLAELTPNKIVGVSNSCTGCDPLGSKPYIFAVDTLGNLLFDHHLDSLYAYRDSGENPKIAPYDSSSFVLAWYDNEDYWSRQPYLMHMHEDGRVIWKTSFPNLDPSSDIKIIQELIRTKDGDFVGVGERMAYHIAPELDVNRVAWAFRMSADGKIQWDRVFHEPDVKFPNTQWFWNVVEDEAGDLYFSGQVVDSVANEVSPYQNNNFWLVKVGPDGCIEPGCTGQVIVLPVRETYRILPEHHLQVFPNPVSDVLNLKWEDLPSGKAKLMAHDLNGKTIGSWAIDISTDRMTIEVSTWPKGLAILSLRGEYWMAMPQKVVVK